MSTRCIELILTEDTLRGVGIERDPYRRVTQVFTKDGELLAERDPCLGRELSKYAATMEEPAKDHFLQLIQDLP